MFSPESLVSVEFSNNYLTDLEKFCKACDAYGYVNNASLNAMKVNWCLENQGQFFLTFFKNTLISVSGCHPLPEAGPNCYRALFRGVTLPEYQNLFKVMSKTHMSSIPFFNHLPLQIAWAISKGYEDIVITTNYDNSKIESMNRSHKVFQSLEKQNIVTCLHRKINIFNTDQSVWKVNQDRYFKIRQEFRDRHGLY